MREKDISDYLDIIDLEHHKSLNYPWMPTEDRAAQFAPFAALTGFTEIIEKTAKEHESNFDTVNIN
ncbi:MAG: hypothetical protein HUK23_06670 [Sphaerochaetaceae bacterium]|nr:hypothetical protein [Sphaerochaetaceae bacterium]